MDSIQVAINLILAAQAAAAKATSAKAPAKPAKAPKEPKVASPPARSAAPLPVMPLTVPLIAAHAFVAACRSAGKRTTEDGRILYDRNLVVVDEASAIRTLTGVYYAPHGACLDAARRLATTAINRAAGISTAPRRATATVAGYVAGMPNARGKAEADQRAREIRAARLELKLDVASNEEQVRAALLDESMI